MQEFATNKHADPEFWKPAKLITQLAAKGKTFGDAPVKKGPSKGRRGRG
jgi:hypothetical protein